MTKFAPWLVNINGKDFMITAEDQIWLNQHGGRTFRDVLVNEEEVKYVLMFDPEMGDEMVYLP